MVDKKSTFWQRWRFKYRLGLIDEETLYERWHIKISFMGFFVGLFFLFLLTIGLLALLIIYTPVRNILPGYSANIRQQLTEATTKVDSIGTDLELEKQYIDVLKQVMQGELATDTIHTLDSLQIIEREKLLAAKSEATEEFMAQYEAKEKDHLLLFDVTDVTPVYTFFPPVNGVVEAHYSFDHPSITLRAENKANVMSVLAGTVVYANLEIDNTYTMMVLHDSYLSIYKHVGRILKGVGTSVSAGESIAIVADAIPLEFSLWQRGKSINPEDVIAL